MQSRAPIAGGVTTLQRLNSELSGFLLHTTMKESNNAQVPSGSSAQLLQIREVSWHFPTLDKAS